MFMSGHKVFNPVTISFEKTNLVTDFSAADIPKQIDKKTKKVTDKYVELSVREAIKALSVGHGQGYVKCSCTGKCATNKCSCKKAGIACSSKCHGKQFECANNEKVNLV